jgi:hypothetical protein
MISDACPEDTIYPDSIREKGYLKDIRWTCSCGHRNISQIPIDSDSEVILEYCPACGALNEIIVAGVEGE